MRRGTGVIYILAGLAHACLMVFASLYSLRRLHVYVSPELWKELYYAHFLTMVVGGLIYLGLSFKQSGIFYYEVLSDFLVGIAAFVILLTIVASLLVSGRVNAWFSLAPSSLLLAYGGGLISGRAFGFGSKVKLLP